MVKLLKYKLEFRYIEALKKLIKKVKILQKALFEELFEFLRVSLFSSSRKQTNKQNNFLNNLLYYWRGTYCYRCVCSSYLWCNKWNLNRLSHALKSPSILLRSPNFDCYLLVFAKRCGQVIISVAWWLAAIGAFWCGFTLREVDFILFKWLHDKHEKIIHAWLAKNERIFHVIRLQSSSTSTNYKCLGKTWTYLW